MYKHANDTSREIKMRGVASKECGWWCFDERENRLSWKNDNCAKGELNQSSLSSCEIYVYRRK